ncbi:MAG: hypothetical protein K2I20_00415 [Clostridia bacterium]|nr:hypothetical protein [Clostridia bacterium]MDE7214638.1 hypothetical protein [Clostridia bacterium]
MKRTPNQEIIHSDILRYKTNKLPATLALLAIVFNCLYFCLLYGFQSNFFNNWQIGVSVIITLFSLLITFLSSEGIKGYNKKFCIALLVLAALQIIRIFGIPFQALRYDTANGITGVSENAALYTRYFGVDLSPWACFLFLTIWLCASAACLISSAVIGYINCARLESFNKKIESGEVSVEKTVKEMDEEDEKAKALEVQPDKAAEEVQ